uniref:Probable chitinase 10 n=1 Tax=Diabrotica virgifera virgifera TaxID=50390 RepID=A0A6P7GDA6_DIAVI
MFYYYVLQENFVLLLKDFSEAYKPKGLLVTAALAGAVDKINAAYDVDEITKYLDMLNLMTYDYHGAFDNFIGHISPLHASSLDYKHGRNSTYIVATGLEYWLSLNVDPAKINMGVPTYGRTFTLLDQDHTSLYDPVAGPGKKGEYTGLKGSLGYHEVCINKLSPLVSIDDISDDTAITTENLEDLHTLLNALNNEFAKKYNIIKYFVFLNILKYFRYLDMLNLMTYDYHGAFDNFIGHISPLHASSLDYKHGRNSTYIVATGLEYWLSLNVDPAKINMGVPTYGRTFTLLDQDHTSLYDPVAGPGKKGEYTGLKGSLGYHEICEFFSGSDSTYYWDDEQKVPHRIYNDQWIGYDDERSMAKKIDFAVERGVGGIMVWTLDTDDFTGICGKKYILLNTIKNRLEYHEKQKNGKK